MEHGDKGNSSFPEGSNILVKQAIAEKYLEEYGIKGEIESIIDDGDSSIKVVLNEDGFKRHLFCPIDLSDFTGEEIEEINNRLSELLK